MTASALREPVLCRVLVDGQEITGLYRLLTQVSVDLSRDAAGVCELRFRSVRGRDGRWEVQDHPLLQPWRRLLVQACFGTRTEEVMRGCIKEIRADHPADMGEATVTVIGQDESLLLDRGHVQEAYSSSQQPQTDGDLVQRLAGGAGLQVQAEPGLRNAAIHHDGTPIQLLLARAQANGFELLFRAGKVVFGPPQLSAQAQPVIRVYAGRASNCLRLTVRHDGHQPDEVRLATAAQTGHAAEFETFAPSHAALGRQASGSQGSGLTPFVWNLPQAAGATLAEQRARAQAKANEAGWKLSAEGELDGAAYGHVLLTHAPVAVDGIGPTHSGLWYVHAVRHEFSADGYRQSFRLLRSATGEQFASARADSLAEVR